MAIYNASINSFVHVIMYSYYFLSSFKGTYLKTFLRVIKPVITIIQLAQFVLILGHCIVAVLPDCHAGIFFHLQIANLCVLIILFSHFFFKNFMDKKWWAFCLVRVRKWNKVLVFHQVSSSFSVFTLETVSSRRSRLVLLEYCSSISSLSS